MKKINMAGMTVAMAACLLSINSRAQGWLVTLDEFGNGSYLTNGVVTPFYGQLLPDPSGMLAGPVLVYTLPFNFQQTGDYYMTNTQEPFTIPLTNSDVVRFWGVNQVIFYSDTNDVDDVAEADTGLPATLLTPNVGLLETGVEGGFQDGIHQTIPGDPGFAGLVGGLGITYDFISDVPEPNPLLLGAAGFAGLWLLRRLRYGK